MNLTNGQRLVIVGGVAAGASCAARARRLDESAQITMIERGPDVSFANCGPPNYPPPDSHFTHKLLSHGRRILE